METKIQNREKNQTEDVKEPKREVGAMERCRAVLSIWSGAKRPSQVSREYGVAWAVLNSWEKRALRGMRCALEPRRKEKESPSNLPNRLEILLEKSMNKDTGKKRKNTRESDTA